MDDLYSSILQQYWGYPSFRGIQREIIESICRGHDTLGLMPTGGGKSITFQVPALAMEGVCIVVTPLIALMKDQVRNLRNRGIRAEAIHSGLSRQQISAILDTAVFNGYKLLYVSPERLSSDLFLTKLRHMKVSFITVDEAHCICQWGYDFRPSYLRIADIRQMLPDIPVLALTATATPQNVEDIQDKLQFRSRCVFRMSYRRDNLSYIVLKCPERMMALTDLLTHEQGTCIIYTRNRQNCRKLYETLLEAGMKVTLYHAGLPAHERSANQEAWLSGTCRIIVATNAFGMGIDKPDVRLVLHLDLPDSIEEYFQEAGRAGRDGKPARAVILSDGQELKTLRARPSQTYPPEDFIRTVYEKICFYLQMAVGDGLNVTREFNLQEFTRLFHLNPIQTLNAILLLDNAGYISYSEKEDNASRLRILATRHELYSVIDKERETVVSCLLRNYGGIFVDYCYIDEDLIAHQTGLDFDKIYSILVDLSKAHIIDYIPRKKMPRITFLQRRVDTEQVVLPASVYERRKECYIHRIQAMEAYCISMDCCRSRMLLQYFGEESADCGHCDVCDEKRADMPDEQSLQQLQDTLTGQLERGEVAPHDLHNLSLPARVMKAVTGRMRDEGIL